MTAIRDHRIDVARGVAVIAMVIYHFTWDLAAFGFIDPSTATAPSFRRLGAAIAGAFLFLSGVALVLSRNATPDDAAFRAKFLKRLAILVAAAALVSLGTWYAMGERFVRFGILHCIAASGVVALPFLRMPTWLAVLAAALVLALPWAVDIAAFSHPALFWTGLSWRVPTMVDFVPVFPFAGMALAGVAAGRLLADRPPAETVADSRLAKLGRVSLPVYLIHQPILYGGLFLLASLTATATRPGDLSNDRDTAGFRIECRRTCTQQGSAKEVCDRYCACAETEMKASGVWSRAMASQDTAGLQSDLGPMLQACFAKAGQSG